MDGTFQSLDARHEKKMAPVGGSPHPGDLRDQRLPLSYQGKLDAQKTGKALLPANFDIYVVDRSTLVRTTETAQHMLYGVEVDPDDGKRVVWQPEDQDIGLACGFDFVHPDLPKYDTKLPAADDSVKGILTRFWMPQAGDSYKEVVEGRELTRPVMSRMAAALVRNRINALETYLPEIKKGGKVFHLQATHAPIIDALDAALFRTVQYSSHDGVDRVFLDEEKWPGHYAMGFSIHGSLNGDSTRDFLQFHAQPFRDGRERVMGYTLDDLKVLHEKLQRQGETSVRA